MMSSHLYVRWMSSEMESQVEDDSREDLPNTDEDTREMHHPQQIIQR